LVDSAIEVLVSEVEKQLEGYRTSYKGLSWREKVLLLVEITGKIKGIGIRTNPEAARVAARERIRLYLIENEGIVISARELEVVSGISEYGRRVRELRVQDGYKILTGCSNDSEVGVTLKTSEYLLVDVRPDVAAARRWHIANRIRREAEGGSKGRLLRYFLENVGQVLTTEELAYVAKAREFGRRVRELRTEEGYAIATQFTGRPDLKMAEYILESTDRIAEPHDRKIPFDVQKEVYGRAINTCELCGWDHKKWKRSDPRILELHHISEHAEGGQNIAENLLALCSRCHDDVHAGRRKLPPEFLG
jgi:hypothetical protein